MDENEIIEPVPDVNIKEYPHAERKVSIEVGQYSLVPKSTPDSPYHQQKTSTTFISPHGMEIHSSHDYPSGAILKIAVNLPDYWNRKKKFVKYNRVDVPNDFKILGKVIGSQDIGKRGKKKLILVQTVNIDEVDEKVLKDFLQEGK